MFALTVLAAMGTLMAGIMVLAIVMVSIAIHREEKHLTLTREAPDQLTQAARWLNGAHAQRPRTAAASRPTASSTANWRS
jgi:hypothetical protein